MSIEFIVSLCCHSLLSDLFLCSFYNTNLLCLFVCLTRASANREIALDDDPGSVRDTAGVVSLDLVGAQKSFTYQNLQHLTRKLLEEPTGLPKIEWIVCLLDKQMCVGLCQNPILVLYTSLVLSILLFHCSTTQFGLTWWKLFLHVADDTETTIGFAYVLATSRALMHMQSLL